MTARPAPTRYAFEYPDEAGYPDGKGTLSQDQIVLIDELLDDPHTPAFAIEVPTMTFARSLVTVRMRYCTNADSADGSQRNRNRSDG